jgi:drug/metabolite transporter (DMT)-like permease
LFTEVFDTILKGLKMKKIISWAIAIFVAYIFVKLIFFILKVTFDIMVFSFVTIVFVALLAVFALPVYVIVRKKLFSRK